MSVDNAIHLSLVCPVELCKLNSTEGCLANARLPEVVSALELLVGQWCQQIEQVNHLVALEEMRIMSLISGISRGQSDAEGS